MEYLFSEGLNNGIPVYYTLPGQTHYFEAPFHSLSEINTFTTYDRKILQFDNTTHIMRIISGGNEGDVNEPRYFSTFAKNLDQINCSYFMENGKPIMYPKVYPNSNIYFNVLEVMEDPHDEYSTWFKFVPSPYQTLGDPNLVQGYFYPYQEKTGSKRQRAEINVEESNNQKWQRTH